MNAFTLQKGVSQSRKGWKECELKGLQLLPLEKDRSCYMLWHFRQHQLTMLTDEFYSISTSIITGGP